MPGRTLRGLSLAEMVVVVGLFGILSLLTYSLFHKVYRSAQRGLERTTATQVAVQWYRRWLDDLRLATPSSLTWATGLGGEQQKVLAIQPVESVSNLARPVYSTVRLILYRFRPGAEELQRQEFYQGVPGVTLQADLPVRLSQAELLALDGSPQASTRKLTGVRAWDLGSSLPPPLLTRDLKPLLTVSLPHNQGRFRDFPQEQALMLPICP